MNLGKVGQQIRQAVQQGIAESSARAEPAREIIGVELKAPEGHVSDFMKNLPEYWHDLLWLTVFFLPIIYITSLVVSIFVDAFSGLQNNWLVSGENMSYIFHSFYFLFLFLLVFTISVVSIVGFRILREFVFLPRKKTKYETDGLFNLGLKYYSGDDDEAK